MKYLCFVIALLVLNSCSKRPPMPAMNADGTDNAASIAWRILNEDVTGSVSFTDVISGSRFETGKQGFINFGGVYPNQVLSVWFPKSYQTATATRLLTGNVGHRVKITGSARTYKGKPEVVIHSANDVEFIDLKGSNL